MLHGLLDGELNYSGNHFVSLGKKVLSGFELLKADINEGIILPRGDLFSVVAMKNTKLVLCGYI